MRRRAGGGPWCSCWRRRSRVLGRFGAVSCAGVMAASGWPGSRPRCLTYLREEEGGEDVSQRSRVPHGPTLAIFSFRACRPSSFLSRQIPSIKNSICACVRASCLN